MRRKSVGQIALIAVPMMIAACVAIALVLGHIRQNVIADAERANDTMASVLSQEVFQSVQAIDLALRDVVVRAADPSIADNADLRVEMGTKSTHDFLVELIGHLPQADVIAAVDARGKLIVSSRAWPAPEADFSGRDPFDYLKQHKDYSLFIGSTQLGVISGNQIVYFSRRLENRNGDFIGTVSIGVRPEFFLRLYDGISAVPGAFVRLLRPDGQILVSYPSQIVRDELSEGSKWHALVENGGGHYHSPGHLHESKLMTVRPLEHYSLVINAGVDELAVLDLWRGRATSVGLGLLAVAIAVTTLVCVLFLLYQKAVDAQVKAVEAQARLGAQSKELADVNLCLSNANLRFDSVLTNMKQGVAMFDWKDRIVIHNRSFADMYGLSSEDMAPGTDLATIIDLRLARGIYSDAGRDEYRLRHVTYFGGGIDVPHSEVEHLCDGRYILVSHQPMPGGGWITTHEDITEQKRAENELRRTRNFFNTVVENVPLPIIVKSVPSAVEDTSERRFTLINRAAETLFGIPRDQMIGKNAYEIHSKDYADFVVIHDNKALQAGQQVLVYEKTVKTGNDDIRIITTRKVAIRDDDGRPEYLLSLLEDVTERRRTEQHIAHMAHSDSLTDLPNRAAFNLFLAATIERAARNGEQFTILSVDLDRFKEANDSCGHAVGDTLLREVSRRMQATAAEAFLARIGGDEFALIVTDGTQPVSAATLAARVLATFVDEFEVEGCRFTLGATIGGAVYPTGGGDAKTLMINADIALYRAKAEARGSALFFEPEMSAKLHERRAMEEDLRSAVERRELFLHYQPQKRISGETIGFEALLRWECQKRGMVSPEVFIHIAEERNLIVGIGEWVLREACREAASWPHPLTIAVNVSPIQFRQGDLPRLVHSILLETGLAPARLELEITEGVLIDDFSHAVSILCRLKSLGVRIALDDFGTGYSSLAYLHSFSFDKIKIDRAFVGDLESNHHSMAIVRAVIGLGNSLGVPILAEGVETDAQHASLVQEGCDEVQGYLIGRPLPIADYAKLVGHQAIAQKHYVTAG